MLFSISGSQTLIYCHNFTDNRQCDLTNLFQFKATFTDAHARTQATLKTITQTHKQ